MAKQHPRRKQKLVNPQLQFGVGLQIVGWLYFYIVLFSLLVNVGAVIHLASAEVASDDYIAAVEQLRGFSSFVIVPLSMTFVAMAIHGVFLTHRFAGPLVRVKNTLRDIAARRFAQEVRFRDGDYLNDVALELTNTLAALREDHARLRRMNAETTESARNLVDNADSDLDAAELLTLAHGVLDAAERLDLHLAAVERLGEEEADRVPLPEAEIEAQNEQPVEAVG